MRVAVVGGGIAGLSAARVLARACEVVVFESAARVGGQIGSAFERGFLSEDGPNFIARPLDTAEPLAAGIDGAPLAAGIAGPGPLAAALRDSRLEPAPPRTRFVRLNGAMVRAPSLPLLRALGPLRALCEPLFARAALPDESLHDFLSHRFGARAGGLVARLMASGVYAGDARRLSAREAFPALAARGSLVFKRSKRPPIWSLRAGLGALPAALSEGLIVRLAARVQRIEAAGRDAGAGGAGRGFLVDGEPFDRVILALPAHAAAPLLDGLVRDALASFPTPAPVAVVHLGFAASEVPRGFGALDGDGDLPVLGALFPSSMLPGRAPPGSALVTAICGGARFPEVPMLADDALVSLARDGVRKLCGASSAPSYLRIVRWPAGIPQYEAGHAARVSALRALLPAGVFLAGASYDGVSVPDAAASGEAAARKALDSAP